MRLPDVTRLSAIRRFAAGLALLLALAALTACGGTDDEEASAEQEPQSEAVAFVSRIYEPYTNDENADPVQPEGSDIYSKRLRTLFDKDAASASKTARSAASTSIPSSTGRTGRSAASR